MKIFLQFVLILFYFTNFLFSGTPFDDTIFLIKPEDYKWHSSLGHNLDCGILFISDISYYYYSSPSFFSKNCLNWQYVQQVTDIASSCSVEDYLLFKSVLRSRVFWGSGEQGIIVKDSKINFLNVNDFEHDHDFNLNFFWLREGWVSLDLSRFMCLNRSLNLQIGLIPFEVGRGISYGYAYLQGKGFLGLDPSDVINEFPPGVLLSGEIYNSTNSVLTSDLFCSIIHNHSIYLEEIIEPIYKNRINRCIADIDIKNNEFFRGFGHISSAFVWRLIYERGFDSGSLVVQPYVLCAIIPEIDLRYEAEGKSKIVTLGCMLDYWGDNFIFNIEWAINKGNCHIYAWDKNYLNINNLDGSLIVENTAVFQDSGARSLATDQNQSIILNSPKGICFNGQEIGNNLINSKKRFTQNRQIYLQGAMFVADFGYYITDCFQAAISFGFATGGEDPAYDNDDCSLGTFLPIQQLYTGFLVQTAFGMGGPYFRPIEQDYSTSEHYESYQRIFSDLKYFGYSLSYSGLNNTLTCKLNLLSFWSFISPKEFDFQTLKKGKGYLDSYLGTEIFAYLTYNMRTELIFFLAYSVFSPGGRYNNSKAGFYNQLDKYFMYNYENYDPSIKFNLVYLFNTGFEYYF